MKIKQQPTKCRAFTPAYIHKACKATADRSRIVFNVFGILYCGAMILKTGRPANPETPIPEDQKARLPGLLAFMDEQLHRKTSGDVKPDFQAMQWDNESAWFNLPMIADDLANSVACNVDGRNFRTAEKHTKAKTWKTTTDDQCQAIIGFDKIGNPVAIIANIQSDYTLTQREFSNLKRRLTIARKKGPAAVIAECIHAEKIFGEKGFPDSWILWSRLRYDAQQETNRQFIADHFKIIHVR